jgi:hypothetical protein
MNTLRGHRPMEDDGLQTDVMRFMAIIAFCLVAVLALVKDVAVEQPAANPAPPEPQPVPQAAVEPAPPTPVMSEPAPRTVAVPLSPPALETPPSERAAEQPKQSRGLTLRFASDADFIDLIRRGEVRVYAFAGDQYRLLDRGFVFRNAQTPAAYHELESVPRRVEAALGDTLPGSGWAVRLPERTSSDIRRLADEHTSGQLVIDRSGGVRHVAER